MVFSKTIPAVRIFCIIPLQLNMKILENSLLSCLILFLSFHISHFDKNNDKVNKRSDVTLLKSQLFEFHRKVIEQSLVFKETNIKIYWCVKGDIDRTEAQIPIII